MKLEMLVVITRPEDVLRGQMVFTLYESSVDYLPDDWVVCGKTTIDVDIDTGKLIDVVSAEIDEKIGQATAALNMLEQKKAELLAIEGPK